MMRLSLSIRNRLIVTVVLIIIGLSAQVLVNNVSESNFEYVQEKQAQYLTRDGRVATELNNLILATNDIINIQLEDYLSGVLENTEEQQLEALDEYDGNFTTMLGLLREREQVKYALDEANFTEISLLYSVDSDVVESISNLVTTGDDGAWRTVSRIHLDIINVILTLQSDAGDLKSTYLTNSDAYNSEYSSYADSITDIENQLNTLESNVLTNVDANYVRDVLSETFNLDQELNALKDEIIDFNSELLFTDASDSNFVSSLTDIASLMTSRTQTIGSIVDDIQALSLNATHSTMVSTLEGDLNSSLIGEIGAFNTSVFDFATIRAEIADFEQSEFIGTFEIAQQALVDAKSIYDEEHANFLDAFTDLDTSLVSSEQASVFIISAFIGIIVLAIAFPVILRISFSTRRLERNFKRVAQGDLSFKLKEKSGGDEFENLEKSFNQLVKSLREVVGVIQESSSQLAGISEELAAGTEEASASLNSVSETIRTISHGAKTQSSLIDGLSENMFELRKEVQLATSGIEQASSNVSKLSQRSNILGLNASISAAKAGGSASGFGIVANEIRELAQNSRESSNEINELVNEIVIRLRTLTNDMTQDLERVKSVAGSTAESSSITTSTADEQVIMINEISHTSNDLAELANGLDVLISRFQLKEDK